MCARRRTQMMCAALPDGALLTDAFTSLCRGKTCTLCVTE
jgi:hypothetical protein